MCCGDEDGEFIGKLGGANGYIAPAINLSRYGIANSVRRGNITVGFRATQLDILTQMMQAVRFEVRIHFARIW